MKEFEEKGNPNVEIIGKYIGYNYKIKCKCKICGNEWETSPCCLLRGNGCRKCAEKQRAVEKRLTNEEFLQKYKKLNTFQNLEIIGEYINWKTKIKCKCKNCGRIIELLPNAILKNKYGCKKCDGKTKCLTNEEFLNKYQKNEFQNLEILGEYKGYEEPIKCRCKICGEIIKLQPRTILSNKYGCEKCSRQYFYKINTKTHEEFMKEFEEKGNQNIEILGQYKTYKEKIKCKCKICGNEFEATPANLLRGTGCKLCTAKRAGKQKMLTEEEFLKRFQERGKINEIEIIGEYKGINEKILIKCKHCGEERMVEAGSLINKTCSVGCKCGGRFNEENNLKIKRPDLIKYLVEPEKAERISYCSKKKIKVKCPDCGFEFEMTPQNLNNHGFSCKLCGNKISKPNRFIRNLIKQLKTQNQIKDYDFEYRPNNTRYPYDAYILTNDNKEILVEMQGGFHYMEPGTNKFAHEYIQEHDKIKKEYALNNGYIFIEVECKSSDFDYIKNNLLKTELINFINFSNIDWNEIEVNINKSDLKEICNFYNEHSDLANYEIAKEFHMNPVTISKYLKLGDKLGFCNYIPYVKKKTRKKRKNKDI